MTKRDVLDETLAKRFSWRISEPADISEPTPQPPPPAASAPSAVSALSTAGDAEQPEPITTEATQELRKRRAREREDFADQVARAWQITSPSHQAAATVKLFQRAQGFGVELAGMVNHPRESALLWRLIVRHFDALPAHDRKFGAHALGFMSLSPELRDVAELLAEVAENGSSSLAFMMEMSGALVDPIGRRYPELGRRLARILEEGKTWASREIAARWLGLAEPRDAIPALRRALRGPHARVRTFALEVLLDKTPPAVTEDDVQWLLDDAVAHPLGRDYGSRAFDTAFGYAEALIDAVAKVRPPEGYRPLEIIADGGGAHIQAHRSTLDAEWALRALAAGYPERTPARIDERLFDRSQWKRRTAVEAAALLTEEQARPRLLEAAAGPGNSASEHAKELWFKLFGQACPVSELSGVQVDLLASAPSERFLSCLLVLRGASDDAIGAMRASLLANAPPRIEERPTAAPRDLSPEQRETLVLLLFSVRDHGPRRPGVPWTEREWTDELVRRFGAQAFEGIVRLAARGARVGLDHEWLTALSDLAREGWLSPEQRGQLRAVATEVLSSDAWDGATSPLIALNQVGAPPELLDRLWSIAVAIEPDDETAHDTWKKTRRYHYAASWASDVLIAMKDAPALDARIAEEAQRAFEEREYETLERLIAIGGRRMVPTVLDLAARVVDAIDEDPTSFKVALRSAQALEMAKLAHEGWLLDLVSRPESGRFAIGAQLARKTSPPSVHAALSSALDSTARGGATAADAASSLIWLDMLGLDDARLDGILERAPERERVALIGAMLRVDAPLARVGRLAADLLVSADEEIAPEMLEELLMKDPDGTPELLEAVLPRVTLRGVKESIQDHLNLPSEADLYWCDSDEDDDEDDDSEAVEEDDDRHLD